METTSAAEVLGVSGRPERGVAGARLSELFARHGGTVLGLCRLLLRHREEAEDAVQQTFLSAYRSLLSGTEPRHPAAWLATIARNECWGRIQQRMREPLSEPDPESALPDPLAAAAARADLAALWRAIGELPAQQREALLLREFSGLSYAELAEALAVSEPAVESLLFRARRGLRVRLRPAYGSVSGIAPLAAIREALARAIAGMPDPAATGAFAKIAAAPLAAKLAAGAAAIVVVGGTVAELERGSIVRHNSPAKAEDVRPVRATTGSEAPVVHASPGSKARPSPQALAARARALPVRPAAPMLASATAPGSAAVPASATEPGPPAPAGTSTAAGGSSQDAPAPATSLTSTPEADAPDPPVPGAATSSDDDSSSSSDGDTGSVTSGEDLSDADDHGGDGVAGSESGSGSESDSDSGDVEHETSGSSGSDGVEESSGDDGGTSGKSSSDSGDSASSGSGDSASSGSGDGGESGHDGENAGDGGDSGVGGGGSGDGGGGSD